MSVRPSPIAIIAACFAVLHSGPQAAEYVSPETPAASADSTVGHVPTGTDDLRVIPRNAYESTPAVGIPARSIFRDTRAPYYDNLRDWSLSPSARLSDSARITSDLDLPDFRGSFPLLHRGFAPEDADLKVGPVYFKLRHISAAVLASDNIDHSEDNRESDVLGIVSIGGQILAQLSEGFQIAASGNLVFLPFEGESGYTGFALRAPYSFGLTGAPISNVQVAWQPVIFGLPITIADEFTIGMARFRNGAYDGFSLYDGEDFDAIDRSGIHSVRARRFPSGDDFNRNYNDEEEFLYYSNEISLSTVANLPGENIFRFRASHENIWYFDEVEDRVSLPSVRDRVVASIHSVRENLRFKPHVRYEYFHRDNPDLSSHQLWTGVRGPITDLLKFFGEVGVMWREDDDSQSLLWRTGLFHQPNPYTWHSLVYSRSTSEFQEELDQQVSYRISKTLGPELTATAYTSYHQIDDLLEEGYDRTEWRNGLRFTYLASPKTNFRLTGEHVLINYEDDSEQADSWRARFQVTHRFYERFIARAIYQYEQRTSDREGRDYAENLGYLSLSWLFD